MCKVKDCFVTAGMKGYYTGYVTNSGNVPNGEGVLNCSENEGVYSGFFKDGYLEGKGTCKWPDGSVYEGDFVNGIITGKGKCTWADGAIYEGDWLDGNRTGKGKFIWPDGSI